MNELTQMCMFASWQNTENPRAANPAHLHPEEKTKQISFNRAWEIIMENKTKKHTNISVPRESCHLFCPGKTAQWSPDWHLSDRRKSKAQRTLNDSSHCTKHKSNGGYLLLQGTCYRISVFLTVDRICEHSFYLWGQQRLTSDLPCISSSARLRRGQVFKQWKIHFKMDNFTLNYVPCFFFFWLSIL